MNMVKQEEEKAEMRQKAIAEMGLRECMVCLDVLEDNLQVWLLSCGRNEKGERTASPHWMCLDCRELFLQY